MRRRTTEDTKGTEVFKNEKGSGSAAGTIMRWWKFNAVGAAGMVVQLAALAVLNRWMAGHYLPATAAAIEIALLHNFVWHAHYTWRDRRGPGRLAQLARFHLSNGAVSMAGNLALMPVLVQGARMPVLAANGVAILVCSIVNFCLGDSWVFALKGSVQRSAFSVQKGRDGCHLQPRGEPIDATSSRRISMAPTKGYKARYRSNNYIVTKLSREYSEQVGPPAGKRL